MSAWDVDLDAQSVGPFQIGMTVYEAQMKVHHNPEIPTCDIIYYESEPFSVPLVFFLRKQGLRLEFDSVSQVLVKIVATDMKAIPFSYRGFSSLSFKYP
jgi:hypothetical protein